MAQTSATATHRHSVPTDERQRIVRDVHDSTTKLLVALQLQLARFKRCRVEGTDALVREIETSILDLQSEIGSLGRGRT